MLKLISGMKSGLLRLSDKVASRRMQFALSPTPGASSWQTCAMGAVTCTWAPIEGSPHKNICGGFSAGCWGGELCGAGQVYGGKRRLEKTLANSSEDDLMNE